jgi:hypothetical protein
MNNNPRIIELNKLNDGRLEIKLANGPLGSAYSFINDNAKGNPHYAHLLWRHFADKVLDKTVETIRKEEYDRGYKDGRAKRAKKSWFSCWLRVGDANI